MKFSQTGVSSMMVLIVVVLLLIVFWEVGQFTENFTMSGGGNNAPGLSQNRNCFGSNTAFDCYDQDEAPDFVDQQNPTAPENLIFSWNDDGKP